MLHQARHILWRHHEGVPDCLHTNERTWCFYTPWCASAASACNYAGYSTFNVMVLKRTHCIIHITLSQEYTWAQMKPRRTTSPWCGNVDSLSDLRHMPWTCSNTVWPDLWLLVHQNEHCLVCVQCGQVLQFLLPRWCTCVFWINYNRVSCAHMCSNVEWKSHHIRLVCYCTVQLHSCSDVFPALNVLQTGCAVVFQLGFEPGSLVRLEHYNALVRQASSTH